MKGQSLKAISVHDETDFSFHWKISTFIKFMASGMTHKNIINSWVTVIIILYKLLTWAMAECVTVFPGNREEVVLCESLAGPGLVIANWWKRTRVLSRAESGPGSGDPPSVSENTDGDGGADTRMSEIEWRYHVSKAADFLANSCDICLSTLH